MGYRELIHTVQKNAGFSDSEAVEILDMMVESIAERLEEGERKDFAGQLPAELQEVALNADIASREDRRQDIIQEFMEKERIPENHAKKQVLTAWEALKSIITEGQIKHIKSQMPDRVAAILY